LDSPDVGAFVEARKNEIAILGEFDMDSLVRSVHSDPFPNDPLSLLEVASLEQEEGADDATDQKHDKSDTQSDPEALAACCAPRMPVMEILFIIVVVRTRTTT
jgi:hypothetical protein